MKGLKKLLPGGRKKKGTRFDGDLSVDDGSDQNPSPEQLQQNHIVYSNDRLPVIPQREPRNTTFSPSTTKSTDEEPNSDVEQSHRQEGTHIQEQSSSSSPSQQQRQNGSTADTTTATSRTTTTVMNMEGIDQLGPMPPHAMRKLSVGSTQSESTVPNIFDDAPNVVMSYDAVPLLEQTKLPRGGVSMETEAVGRVQVRCACYDAIMTVNFASRFFDFFHLCSSCAQPSLPFSPPNLRPAHYSLESPLRPSRIVCVLV